ncbi:MAG: 2-hydroxyacyl-CoA dehydratase family protein [Desulfobacterales bacterium]|nr:2-hydroxyacyl-CoA dehydratase family protein [Desulfobacterales bacterium]
MTKQTSRNTIRKEIEGITSCSYRDIVAFLPKDRLPVGFFCPLVPEELIHAAGALPFRLMGTPVPITHAQAHLPPYCCHLVKASLESLLQGELHFLRGIVFCQTCDSMQGLSDILAHQRIVPWHFNLMIPTHLDSAYARPYLRAEMERFKNFLESNVGRIAPRKLKASIELFNRIRERLGEIYVLRRTSSSQIPGAYFARIIRAGYWMDRVRYLELLEGLVDSLPKQTEGSDSLIPVYLTGNMTHADTYFSLIEDAGAIVVQDDLCSGARTFRLMVAEDRDPLEALIERYFQSYFCPTKYWGPQAHIDILVKEVEDSKAQGVIFLLYKYCEACFFDYPDLKSALESRGIPTLLLEVEDPSQAKEQLKIRIQAFVEMLSPL